MASHTAVTVDDDLAAGQAGIAHGATHYETSGGIDVVLGIGIEHVGGNRLLDDVLQHFGTQLFIIDEFGVLG